MIRIKTWNKVTRYLAKRYRTINLWLNIFDNRFEYDNEFYGYYTPRQYLWLCFKAWIKKDVCWKCKGHGRTGYYEPENCSTCDGFGFNWKQEREPDWESMTESFQITQYQRGNQDVL